MSDSNIMSDEEIIEKIRSENSELYVVIIERYKDKLLRYVKKLLHDTDKANHVVQDAFIKAYVNLNGFNVQKKFSSWIYRIAHNEALNVIKKNKKEVPLLDDFDFESDQNIEEEFDKKICASDIEKCLAVLPVIYSEPLILYYFEEKSYKDISDILRIPMGTVAIRVNRAKKLMKHICQKK